MSSPLCEGSFFHSIPGVDRRFADRTAEMIALEGEVQKALVPKAAAKQPETVKPQDNVQIEEAEEPDFDDLYEQVYPDSIDPYSKIRYNKDGTVVVTDDWRAMEHTHIAPKYRPNAVVDVVSHQGQCDRVIYDEKGYFKTFIHGGDHNQPKYHQYGKHGEHAHDVIFDPVTWKMIGKIDRELTPEERIQHADIIRRGK